MASGGRCAAVAVAALAACIVLGAGGPAAPATTPRSGPTSGLIVSTNGDEEIRFVAEEAWRSAEIEQDLLAGDQLRTGPVGALALRFADQTLIRLHRNSELLVKEVLGAGAAQLQLNAGQIWARAATAGRGVDVATPSATAAIRGTDWSLAVDADGRTTLIVIAGEVELSNPQGAVTVRAGEAAVAEIGRAPAKIILATAPGREQFLYYVSLRDAYGWLPLTPLDSHAARRRLAELQAVPEAQRTADEWLDLTELGMRIAGSEASRDAVARARALGGLSREQAARATLVEGMLTAQSRNWDEAAALFAEAEPDLTGDRQFAALFGRYVALALAGRRDEAETLRPALDRFAGSRAYILGQAWVRGNIGEIEGALADLKAAQSRHPGDADIAVLAAVMAILLGRDADARTLTAAALAIDPDNADALNVQATILSDYDWETDRAAAVLERAVAVAPGNADAWNTLGLARHDQGDWRGAAEAYETAIRLDPNDPVPHANYAILLLDVDDLDGAKAQIDRVKELDPSFYVGLLAEGRWLAQQGRMAEARDAFLDAVVANPALSNSYLALAIAYYQQGEAARAEQALANADSLDPNDPLVPLVDTVIALDHAEADRAITSARESYRRYRKRGGVYNPLAATREGGSYLNAAFGELSLTDWGRFYGDLTFNPFDSGSQFFQAAAPRVNLVENGSASEGADINAAPAMQGLLLDPLAVSARNRYSDLLRRPFFDSTFSAGTAFDTGGFAGWEAGSILQGYTDEGLPMAFFASIDHAESDLSRRDASNDDWSGTLAVGSNLGLSDRLLVIGSYAKLEDEIPRESTVLGGDDVLDTEAYLFGAGYSHSFGPRDVLMASLMVTGATSESDVRGDLLGTPFTIDDDAKESGVFFGVAHNVEVDRVTFRYGIEGQTIDREVDSLVQVGGVPIAATSEEGSGLQGRAYADVLVRLDDHLMAEGGAYLTGYDDGIDTDRLRVDPRVGVAWLAGEGQWLRAGYREETLLTTATSLAPVTTVGLTSGLTPVEPGGVVRSLLLRWDAEWSDRVFTAIELEHQDVEDFSVGIRDTLDPFGALAVGEGRIDRATIFANAWVGHGVGLFGRFTVASSENTSGDANDGADLPLVPEWQGRFGVTWVHPSQVSVTLAENLIGERAGDATGTEIDDAATTDLEVTWQPFDRHLQVGAAALNLFDADYELATGIAAPGRTFLLRGEVRF
jgi:tetratricopeptide (TPR) repeat protein